MAGIKTTPADQAFSLCVRARAGWRCEVCNTQYQKGAQGLHCSHFHGRGNWGVRLDPDNASAHCFGCHQKMGANPHEHTDWTRNKLGEFRYQALIERKNDISLGKLYRKTKGKGEIAKHYRDQLKLLEDGAADFDAWL